jgi:transposase InsO family protein
MNKDTMAKYIERAAVMKNLAKGTITQVTAALQLNLSVRQVRRLYKRHQADGVKALFHRNQGKPNSRKISSDIEQKAIDWILSKGPDFGATFAQEKLDEYLGIKVSVSTVRGWLIKHKILRLRRKSNRQQFKKRERKACFGLMVQVDGSEHDWFEGRGDRCLLLTCIDDATGIIVARFATGETTKDLMLLFKKYIELYGRPHMVYSDHGGPYKVNTGNMEGEKKTELGRALDQLGIELVFANSPQAKGRIERNHGTHQDRLIKEMRLRGISTITAANEYLEKEYITHFNRKFTVQPANLQDAHRSKKSFNLDLIFTMQEERVMQNDGIVQYKKMLFQITKNRIFVKQKSRILIREHLDNSLSFWIGSIQLGYEQIDEKPAKEAIVKQPKIRQPTKPSQANKDWCSGIYSPDRLRPCLEQIPQSRVKPASPDVEASFLDLKRGHFS